MPSVKLDIILKASNQTQAGFRAAEGDARKAAGNIAKAFAGVTAGGGSAGAMGTLSQWSGSGGKVGKLLSTGSGGMDILGDVFGGGGKLGMLLGPEVGIITSVLGTAFGGVAKAFGAIGRVAGGVLKFIIDSLESAVGAAARLGSGLLKVGGAAALAAAAGFGMLMKSIVDAGMKNDRLKAQLLTAHKTPQAAAEQMAWIKGFEPKASFNVEDIVASSNELTLMGMNARQWLPLVGDLGAAMGINITEATQAVVSGINGEVEALRHLGISYDDLKKHGAHFTGMGISLSAPGDREALMAAVAATIPEKFGGGMARMMDTVSGRITNLQTVLYNLKVTAWDTFAQTFGTGLQMVQDFFQKALDAGAGQKLGAWVNNIGQSILAGAPAIISAAGSLGSAISQALNLGSANPGAWIATGMDWAARAVLWLAQVVRTYLPAVAAWFRSGMDVAGKALSYLGQMAGWVAGTVADNWQNLGMAVRYGLDVIIYGAGRLYQFLPNLIIGLGEVASIMGALAMEASLIGAAWLAAAGQVGMAGKLINAGMAAGVAGVNAEQSARQWAGGIEQQQSADTWGWLAGGKRPWWQSEAPTWNWKDMPARTTPVLPEMPPLGAFPTLPSGGDVPGANDNRTPVEKYLYAQMQAALAKGGGTATPSTQPGGMTVQIPQPTLLPPQKQTVKIPEPNLELDKGMGDVASPQMRRVSAQILDSVAASTANAMDALQSPLNFGGGLLTSALNAAYPVEKVVHLKVSGVDAASADALARSSGFREVIYSVLGDAVSGAAYARAD